MDGDHPVKITPSVKRRSPAVFASTKIALPAAATPLRPFTTLRRTRFIHHQRPAHQRPPVARLDSLIGRRGVVDLDKSESSGFTAETISQYIHAVHVNTSFFKKSLQICFRSFVGQVAYEQLCH
jgi:hypothetical protein